MPARVARLGGILLVYAGLVAWLTWPLAAHLSTHLAATNRACGYDTLYMAWALAFESHTLAAGRLDVADANIFHPARHTLFYGDTGFGALPYFLPVFLATGNPTLAINLACFGCIVLTAWTLHVVAARWTGEPFAGVAAAATYLANPWVLWGFIPSAPAYAVLQYLPLIVLLAAIPAPRFTQALRLLPLVVLQALADVAYVAPAVFAPLGLLAVVRLVRPSTRAAGACLLGVLALAALALAPVYAAHLSVWGRMADPVKQTVWQIAQPPAVEPWAPFVREPTAVSLPVAALVVVGALAFAARARRSDRVLGRRAWTHAALWTAVGLYISLPGSVRVGGTLLRLPNVAAISGAVRVPQRLGVAAVIGTALLAGLAFAECLRWLPGRGRVTALAARVVASALLAGALYRGYAAGVEREYLGVGFDPSFVPRKPDPIRHPYPLALAVADSGSTIMQVLRRPGGPLLELPANPLLQAGPADGAVPRGPHLDARAMYRSTYHWRPLLNGYSSYWPPGYVERITLAQQLPDAAALATLRRETGLDLILVHVETYSRWRRALCEWQRALRQAPYPACQRDLDVVERAWLAALGRPDLRLVANEGLGELLFQVVDVP